MNRSSQISKFTISLVLSLVILSFGVAGLAQQQTQTPSEKVREGTREVIEGILNENNLDVSR